MFEAILSAQGVCGTPAYRPPENRRLYDASPGNGSRGTFFAKLVSRVSSRAGTSFAPNPWSSYQYFLPKSGPICPAL